MSAPLGEHAWREPYFTPSQALHEACRCLQCFDAPCARACPAGIVIPRFVRMIRSGNVTGAAEVVRSANPMAASCGNACPDEQLCGAACLRGELDAPIAIRKLHRFATEWGEVAGGRDVKRSPLGSARVAIVGAGPAGMTCAAELVRRGIRVTLFEARSQAGGVLSHLIPLYRFSTATIAGDAAWALGKGVTLKLGRAVRDVENLARRFDAVFVAPGTTVRAADIPGSQLKGVWNAGDFLELCRRRRYRNRVAGEIVVIGGGNVAVDAALAAVRCGMRAKIAPRVHLLYRRTRLEMPAWEREVREAEQLGVIVHFLVAPQAFIGERGKLRGVKLHRMTLGAPDASGRPKPEPIADSDFPLPCDAAILATGMQLAPEAWRGLPRTRNGLLRAHRKSRRVRGSVFAGGDATGQEMTVVAAVRDGKLAAAAIARELGRTAGGRV